jgi:hypothetical protein
MTRKKMIGMGVIVLIVIVALSWVQSKIAGVVGMM